MSIHTSLSQSKGKNNSINEEEESSDSSAVSEPVAKTSNSIDSLISPRLTRRKSTEKSSFFNFSFGKDKKIKEEQKTIENENKTKENNNALFSLSIEDQRRALSAVKAEIVSFKVRSIVLYSHIFY